MRVDRGERNTREKSAGTVQRAVLQAVTERERERAGSRAVLYTCALSRFYIVAATSGLPVMVIEYIML
jgi:hypothetical protein